MRSLLLDTCVLLDLFVPERPSGKGSRALVDCCIKNDIAIFYSASSATDVFYLIKRALKAKASESESEASEDSAKTINRIAFSCMESLQNIATSVGSDDSDIWLARKYECIHPDFEDNMVFAAMERSKADFLVTNDEQLLKDSPYAAMDSASMLAYLESMGEVL